MEMDEDTDCDNHSEDVDCNEGKETDSDAGELLIQVVWKCTDSECNFMNTDDYRTCYKCDLERIDVDFNKLSLESEADKILYKVKREFKFERFQIYNPGRRNYGDHLIVEVAIAIPPELDYRIEPQILRPIYKLFVNPAANENDLRASVLKMFLTACPPFNTSYSHSFCVLYQYIAKILVDRIEL